MTTTILLVIVIVALLAVVAWLAIDRRRSQTLRTRFGSEYERTVRSTGDRREAEAELAERQRRVESLSIRPLQPADRDRFQAAWREAQARFVDDPRGAIGTADDLIGEVMEARGYPVGDFERRADDVSVDHADVVEHYRIAHRIATESSSGMPDDTESLRQAMVHYRALFASLLETSDASATPESPREAAPDPTVPADDRLAEPSRTPTSRPDPVTTRSSR